MATSLLLWVGLLIITTWNLNFSKKRTPEERLAPQVLAIFFYLVTSLRPARAIVKKVGKG
jgi:hypothetical protein